MNIFKLIHFIKKSILKHYSDIQLQSKRGLTKRRIALTFFIRLDLDLIN